MRAQRGQINEFSEARGNLSARYSRCCIRPRIDSRFAARRAVRPALINERAKGMQIARDRDRIRSRWTAANEPTAPPRLCSPSLASPPAPPPISHSFSFFPLSSSLFLSRAHLLEQDVSTRIFFRVSHLSKPFVLWRTPLDTRGSDRRIWAKRLDGGGKGKGVAEKGKARGRDVPYLGSQYRIEIPRCPRGPLRALFAVRLLMLRFGKCAQN
jgi:hypothetical protein